jgi:glycosyltransferase involved in cell wall biosynthesis
MLIIAGKDEFGHKKEIEIIIKNLRLQSMVRFLGPLYGQNKLDAFSASNVFVLPSYSEGSPMVVLDSLAAGVPVITTKMTPWESLVAFKCGWWVDPSVEGLVESLRSMMVLSPGKLKDMGKRGKELVRSQYLWSAQAQKTIDLYEWLLGRKSKPDFVIID